MNLRNNIVKALNGFEPSEMQANFFTWLAEGEGSAILEATAGSGKTTTALHGARVVEALQPRASITYVVFAARNAKEAKAKFQDTRVVAGTHHSLAFRAYVRGRGKIDVDDAKSYKVLDEVLPGYAKAVAGKDVRFANWHWDDVRDKLAKGYASIVAGRGGLVAKAKAEGVGYLKPDEPESWWDLVNHYDLWLDGNGVYTMDEAIEIARLVLKKGAEREELIDFDDMLYMPLIRGTRFFQSDYLLVDEAQDSTAVQIALFKRMLKPKTGRLIAIGDPYQSVFGFRGAKTGALEAFKREFGCVQLPLTVSYRCSKAAVELAREFSPEITAHEANAEGAVDEMEIKDFVANAKALRPGKDAILCRNTGPLVGLCYQLISSGVAANVLGREIGKGLVSTIRRMGKVRDLDELLRRLNRWAEREMNKALGQHKDSVAQGIEDRRDAIATLAGLLPEDERSVAGLTRRIEEMFTDSENGGVLKLSTIHKAKGLEWDAVYILRPDLMPSKWAKQEHMQEQERNLQFVAYTRTRDRIVFVNGAQ